MKRGDVFWVSLEPAVGGEINKTRSAVILSNDIANRFLNRVIMVPLTTNVSRILPGEALVTVAGVKQKVLGSQLRTVSKLRIGQRLGTLSEEDLFELEKAVLLQLDIDFL